MSDIKWKVRRKRSEEKWGSKVNVYLYFEAIIYDESRSHNNVINSKSFMVGRRGEDRQRQKAINWAMTTHAKYVADLAKSEPYTVITSDDLAEAIS